MWTFVPTSWKTKEICLPEQFQNCASLNMAGTDIFQVPFPLSNAQITPLPLFSIKAEPPLRTPPPFSPPPKQKEEKKIQNVHQDTHWTF